MKNIRIACLDHTDPAIATDIHSVMMMAYGVEAKLLGISDFPPLRRARNDISRAESSFIGSFLCNELAGVLEYEMHQEARIGIAAVVVLPNFFRLGLGTALVRHIIQTLKGARIEVCTAAANAPALSLYRQQKFDIAGSWIGDDRIAVVKLVNGL